MPSDNTLDLVRKAFEEQRNAFSSGIAAAAEQVRGTLASLSADSESRNSLLKTQLGGFAAGRINIEKFSTFAEGQQSVDSSAAPTLKKAQAVLSELSEAGDKLFQVKIGKGKTVRCGVSRGLAKVGRAFGAARCIELAKAGAFIEAEHGKMMDGLHFADWSQAERAIAPPIMVEVDGRSFHPSALAEFMDGNLKIALIIHGDSSPAPLARLIAPNTVIMQSQDGSQLEQLASWNGHGIAAIVPKNAAVYTYVPSGGTFLAEALQISHMPDEASLVPLGSLSVQQQAEELALLSALAGACDPHQDEVEEAPANPVDQLAAFLLNKANLEV